MSTLIFSTRREVDSRTSNRRSPSCTTSPGSGMCPAISVTKSADGGGVRILGETDSEELFEAIGFKGSEDDVAVIAFANGLVAQLAFIAELADNFLDEILDGDQTGDAAVFVDDDGHAAIGALHFIEQLAGTLGFRDEDKYRSSSGCWRRGGTASVSATWRRSRAETMPTM